MNVFNGDELGCFFVTIHVILVLEVVKIGFLALLEYCAQHGRYLGVRIIYFDKILALFTMINWFFFTSRKINIW